MTLRDKITREIGEMFAQQADFSWFEAEKFTESPIETAFVVAFEWQCRMYCQDFVIQRPPASNRNFDHLRQRFGEEWIHVEPQATIGDYRVDFLVTFGCTDSAETLIVECDGHDFHDRTHQQASRDRERDRSMVMSGFRVFRFTGTDLNRRPLECVTEIAEFILRRRTEARREG